MNSRTYRSVFLIVSIIFLVFISLHSNAQPFPEDPGCDPGCPNVPGCPPQCIPIDGGLSLLIAAGIGVGVWRGRRGLVQSR